MASIKFLTTWSFTVFHDSSLQNGPTKQFKEINLQQVNKSFVATFGSKETDKENI